MLGKVKEWRSSGLSMNEFASKHGFSKTGFNYWVKKNRKLTESKPVSFVELSPAVKPGEIVEVLAEPRDRACHPGSVVITFPGGMSVKIYG